LGTNPVWEREHLQQLVGVLGPQTDTYFFGSVAEGAYRWDADGMPTDWLERGAAGDWVELVAEGGPWPTYTFAADHAWCFYQGEEQEAWLALGCSATMAQALQAHPTLEVLPFS